jgi:hypothetical protein
MIEGWNPPGKGEQRPTRAPGYRLTIAVVAVDLGVLPPALAKWRQAGVGPSWCRDGEHQNSQILYHPREIAKVREDMQAARAVETKAAVEARIEHATTPPAAKRRAKKPRTK